MSGLFTALCVLLAAGLALAARMAAGAPRQTVLAFCFAAPALLLGGILLTSRDSFGDLHLRLESFSFGISAARTVSIGGDGAADDLVVDRIPSGFIESRRDGQLAIDLFARPSTRGGGAEATVAELEGGARRGIAGAHRLEPGDRFCLERCSSETGVWYALAPAGDRLALIGRGDALPAFPAGWLGWRHYSPRQMIFPLRHYGVPAGTPRTAPSGDPCADGALACIELGRRPADSFIFRDGGLALTGGGSLFIMLLDREAVFLPAGAGSQPARATAPVVDLRGEAAPERITIYEVVYAPPELAFGPDAQASRLARRQSLTLAGAAPGTVTLRPSLAPVEIIRRDLLRRASARTGASARSERGVVLNLVGSREDGTDVDRPGHPVRAPLLGAAFLDAHEVIVRIPSVERAGETLRIEGASDPAGRPAHTPLGDAFRIGAAEPARGGPTASLRIDQLQMPWLVLAVAFGWAILIPVAQARTWSVLPVNAMVLAGVQFMLAVRLLVAIGAVALDPRRSWSESVGGGLIAYVAVPLLLAALSRRADGGARDLWWPAAFTFVTTVAVGYSFGSPGRFPLLLAGLAIAAAIFAPLIGYDALASGAAAGRRTASRLRSLLARPLARMTWLRRFSGLARTPWWAQLILAACAFRVALAMVGIRERLPFEPGLALTIVYVPLLLLGFAGLIHAARDNRAADAPASTPAQPSRRRFATWAGVGFVIWMAAAVAIDGSAKVLALAAILYAFGLLAAATVRYAWRHPSEAGAPVRLALWLIGLMGLSLVVIPLAVVSDWGLAIFGLAIVAVASTIVVRARNWWQAGAWSAPALAVPVFVAALTLGLPWWQSFDWRSEARAALEMPNRDEAAARVLGRIADNNNNLHRLRLVFHSEQVASAGTDVAESLLRWSAQLRQYTSSTSGEGFLARSTIGDLWPVQADDNVSAVHLAYPYGRRGAAAFLLVLGMLAWTAAKRSDAPRDTARLAGELALWTFFVVGSYMVLANLQLLPFTGRNVYLLAAFSNSDAVEGAVLAWLALFGLARVPAR